MTPLCKSKVEIGSESIECQRDIGHDAGVAHLNRSREGKQVLAIEWMEENDIEP